MKKKKNLRSWLEKNAEHQTRILAVWVMALFVGAVIIGVILNYAILERIVPLIAKTEIEKSSVLSNGRLIIFLVCLLLFVIFSWKAYRKARVIIPENHVILLECFEKFVGENTDTLENGKGIIGEGLHFVFPYFNIFKAYNDDHFFLGKTGIELFEEIDKEKDFPVDVKDTSVNLAATVMIKISNPILAAYNVDDYEELIVKKCEAALRRRCIQYDLKGLLENKKDLTLESIFDDLDTDNKSMEIKKIKEDIGVEILEFIVTDIGIQKKDLEEREKILKAENEKRVSEIDNAKRIEKAKTDAKELGIKTQSEMKRTKGLAEADAKRLKIINEVTAENLGTLTAAEAGALKEFLEKTGLTIEEFLKKEWIDGPGSNAKNTFIFGDSNGIASLGAQFAVGSNSQKESQKEKEA